MLSLRQSSEPDSFAQADEEDLVPDPWRLVTFPVKVDTRDTSDALLQAEGTLKLEPIPQLRPGEGHDFTPQYPFNPLLKLPSLDDFQLGCYSLEDISEPESIDTSSFSERGEVLEDAEDDAENIWTLPTSFEAELKVQTRYTWQSFCDRAQKKTLYLSDAGPGFWEAVSRSRAAPVDGTSRHEAHEEPVVVKQDVELRAFFLLGMGLESVLFEKPAQGFFRPRTKSLRLFGLSHEVMNSVGEEFAAIGANFMSVEVFAQHVYDNAAVSPTKVALAETMRTLVDRLKKFLIQALPSQQSLLQLQSLYRVPGLILERLDVMLQKAKTRTQDVDILDAVYESTQQNEYSDPRFIRLMREVLKRVSASWLDGVSVSVGLRHKVAVKGDVVRSIEAEADAYAAGDLDRPGIAKSMPSFISEEDGEMILQTCHTLKMLEAHNEGVIDLQSKPRPPALEWGLNHFDIERIEANVHQYERSIDAASQCMNDIQGGNGHAEDDPLDEGTFSPFGASEKQVGENIFRSYDMLDRDLQDDCETDEYDSFHSAISNALSEQDVKHDLFDIPPPLFLTSSLSFHPLLSSHSRYLSLSLLRTLFTRHKLHNHFAIQHLFHLFGSGTFTTRLTQVLFSPTISLAERISGSRSPMTASAGAVRNISLHLGSHTAWLPAFSELRLTLAGILTDSYQASSLSSSCESHLASKLLGSISFAIRPLPQPEMEACLDPHSLSALDFLRLSYTPPPALEPVITASSLDAYDQIFRLLLQTARVLFVSTSMRDSTRTLGGEQLSLPIATRRLRFETHVFVSACAAHFHAEVASLWTQFERDMRDLAAKLGQPDALQVLGEKDSLHGLRSMHERMLEEMRGALLLKPKQAKVMCALDEVWGLVLADGDPTRGAGVNQSDVTQDRIDTSGEANAAAAARWQLHDFRTKRKAFLDIYRTSREKDAALDGEEIDGLLLRLEMSAWDPS